jgi:peptide/nickel transport system substrate-binding protein
LKAGNFLPRPAAALLRATCAALLAGVLATVGALHAKSLRYASQDDPQTADPHSANLLATSRLTSNIYEPLVFRGKDWKPIPWLATSWKQLNDRTWRFTLREGVKFHDGAPFTADDVVFSVERALSSTSQMRVAIQGVEIAKKVDTHTVDLFLKEPNPALLHHLTNFRIMNKAWCVKNNATRPQDYKAKEDTYSVRNANGTGAFKLREWSPDVRVVLTKHADWWGEKAGVSETNLTEVTMLPIKSNATRLAALISGEVDIVIDPPTQDVARLKREAALKVQEGLEMRVQYLAFDLHRDELLYATQDGKPMKKNPFKDLRVRQAVAHAIDANAIRTKVMRGLSKPIGAIMVSQTAGYHPDGDKHVPYDLPKAKKLLAEAGYPKGFEVTLDCGNNQPAADICQAVAVMLTQAGIRTIPNIVIQSNLFPKLEKYDTSFYLLSWGSGVTSDALYTLNLMLHSVGPKGSGDFNMGRWSNAEFDKLVEKIKVEGDEKKRNLLVRDAMIIANKELPNVYIHQPLVPWVMKKNVEAWFSPVNTVYFARTKLN